VTKKNKELSPKTVNIALQGGGAHGAFAWGILDKLLEDGRLKVDGFTATSAGTMNALAFAQGMLENGADGARAKMEEFWREISDEGVFYSPVRGTPFNKYFGLGHDENPMGYFWFDTMTRLFSPYQYNPLDVNPLREVIERVIDFDKIKQCNCIKLFISATNVKTGKVKVFRTQEISAPVAEASACLPFLFQAVEIDGEHYWDGGYMGNPALFPLFYDTETLDIVLINLNPMTREEIPTTAQEIMNRVNEISFNATLMNELRAINFINHLYDDDMVNDNFKKKYKDIRLHPIRADDIMKDYSVASKFDTNWALLTELRDKGRAHMSEWIETHLDNIGEKSSVDLKSEFL
jgi:NTE family protein